jgi:uncharacterized protein YndB with AHSA1/START domain
MENSPIVVEITLNAPASKVWKAITSDQEMKKWYFDLPGFKAEKGYKFHFNGGTEHKTYLHLCEVLEVVPEKKLSYSWRYDGYEGNSKVSFDLTPEGDKTKLKLTHEGLETFPPNPDFARNNFVEGWNQIIKTSLKNYLEG